MTYQIGPLDFLDPECKPSVARAQSARAGKTLDALPIIEVRQRTAKLCQDWNIGGPLLQGIETTTLSGAIGPRRVRRYTPRSDDAPQPTLFYMHGGGWITGDIEAEDRYLRELALESGVQILSLEYALAPENRFPLPLYDCEALIESALLRAESLRIDPMRIALGGTSAGANLAMAVAMMLRDCGKTPSAVLLNCGVFTPIHHSRGEPIDATGPSPADIEFMLSLYLQDASQRLDPRVDTVNAQLKGLPFTRIIAAGLDPLRDDSLMLATKLSESGVANDIYIHAGMTHAFMVMCNELRTSSVAIKEASDFLTMTLHEH